MIHTSDCKPMIIPHNGTGTYDQIDRLQDMSASVSLNRNKIKEIGRDGAVGWKAATPNVSLTLRQLEYGSLDFFRSIANKAASVTSVDFADIKTSYFDIAAFKTEETSGAFLSTIYYPKQRVTGFGINIGAPDASLERTFNLIGEDEYTYQGNNKYLIYLEHTVASGLTEDMIVIGSGDNANWPDPVLDPDLSGNNYLVRVTRVRSGLATDLVENTDYTWTNGTTALKIISVLGGDIIRVWYTASTYISGQSLFVDNDVDNAEISADCCSIYLATSNYVYRLQSVGIDVSYDRTDYKEIGNKEIVLRGAKDITVNITLGRFLEAWTVEEILRGETAGYGKIDAREFPTTGTTLIVKVYSDNTKSTFKLGYKVTNVTVQGLDKNLPVDDYIQTTSNLQGDGGLVCSTEGGLA